MCTAASQKYLPDFLTSTEGHSLVRPDGRPAPIRSAADVPLGEGTADAAKTAILTRRERIRLAVEGGDPNPHLKD